MGYATLFLPLIVAGMGIGMIFATTASAATSAVPVSDTGVAAGTNTALRELGGVFGIAIVAAVFAHNGGLLLTGIVHRRVQATVVGCGSRRRRRSSGSGARPIEVSGGAADHSGYAADHSSHGAEHRSGHAA